MGLHLLLLLIGIALCQAQNITNETLAAEFSDYYNSQAQLVFYQSSEAAWNYNTNITDYNQQAQINASLVEAAFSKEAAGNASLFDWRAFTNGTLQRIFRKIADIGTSAMKNETKFERLQEVLAEMEEIYSTGNVCLSNGQCLELEPGLTQLLQTSRNYVLLTEAWKGWRDVTGPKIKPLYEEFVQLSNEAIRDNGCNNTADYWISDFESSTFEADIERLYQQLAPLYRHLHAYTRRHLMELYGKDKFPESGHIPAHILGNMWAQTWGNIQDELRPFKNKQSVDVTPQMVKQNYTALRMFNTSDQFFESLGLIKMPPEFWNKSMIEKPTDRNVVCHASAWDFYNGKDFRVKQCTDITMDDLITVHHEMGHIEYYLQYRHLPVVFRSGANSGFHEAIGDVLALSVATPKHLEKIGLLFNVTDDYESDINFLMSTALEKIAFLPFGYLIDLWRWSVFQGQTTPETYNQKWWELRCKYQGIVPPVKRSEADFDPAAKYHIPSNTPYIRYFVSTIIQFQFHKALCQAANHTGPLHKCDIYQSTAAGAKLSAMLQLGSSRPWPEAMQQLTNSTTMDAGPLMEYFKPLIDWLTVQNKNDRTGWADECPSDWPLPETTTKTPVTTTSSAGVSGWSLGVIIPALLMGLLHMHAL